MAFLADLAARSDVLRQVSRSLQQWALEGPPRNPRAAAAALAEELQTIGSPGIDDTETGLKAELEELKQRTRDWEAMICADRQVRADGMAGMAALQAENDALKAQVTDFSAENAKLRRRVASLSAHLMSVLTPVSAVCRARPMESYTGSEATSMKLSLAVEGSEITVEDMPGRKRKFRIDRVLDGTASQEDLFETAAPWVEHAALGGSACVLAYGSTGSGKTHSILGDGSAKSSMPGLAHYALRRLIDGPGGGDVKLSMLEVYCEQIRDLLAPCDSTGPPTLQCCRRDAQGRMMLDCIEVLAKSSADAEQALLRGFANRATEGTLCNERSSRSHVVLTVQVSGSSAVPGGRLFLVDLAGSENVQRSGADEGGKLLTEAKAINRSLSALADVVEATAKQQTFVPYRNSRLTVLLEEALSDSKVLLLVHVSPLLRDATDTAHSLQFASRVRAVDFGAQRLRQDQEERARAASVRSQQETRQLQTQLDQIRRELTESQKAEQDLKQQTNQLAAQLREKQRELQREQELRSKAEELSREHRFGSRLRSEAPSLARQTSREELQARVPRPLDEASATGSPAEGLSPRGSERTAAVPEPGSRLLAPRSLPRRACRAQQSLEAEMSPMFDNAENVPPSSAATNVVKRMPLGDRTNSEILTSNSKDPGNSMAAKFMAYASPKRRTSLLEDDRAPLPSPLFCPRSESMEDARLDKAFKGLLTPDRLESRQASMSQRPSSSPPAFLALRASPQPQEEKKRTGASVITHNGVEVRSILKRIVTDFRGRMLRRQELGLFGYRSEGRHIRISEEKPVPHSPPRPQVVYGISRAGAGKSPGLGAGALRPEPEPEPEPRTEPRTRQISRWLRGDAIVDAAIAAARSGEGSQAGDLVRLQALALRAR